MQLWWKHFHLGCHWWWAIWVQLFVWGERLCYNTVSIDLYQKISFKCSVDARSGQKSDPFSWQVHRPSSLPAQQGRDTPPCIQASLSSLYFSPWQESRWEHSSLFRLASLLEELCLVGSPVFVHALGKSINKFFVFFWFCQLEYYQNWQGCGGASLAQQEFTNTLVHPCTWLSSPDCALYIIKTLKL